MQEAEKRKGDLESVQEVQMFWSVNRPAGTGRNIKGVQKADRKRCFGVNLGSADVLKCQGASKQKI